MSALSLSSPSQRDVEVTQGFNTLFSLRNGHDKEVVCTSLAKEPLSPKPSRSPHFSLAARIAGVDGPSAFKAVVQKATTAFHQAK
jgi:hypothetical protein